MEALYKSTDKERLAQLLLGNTHYQNGFERDFPLPDIEIRERQLLVEGYISIHRLRQRASWMYPWDTDLASHTWKVLLRNDAFFQYAYPGFGLRGRECDFDFLHIATGQSRDKMFIEGIDDSDMLLDPNAWAIGIMSLKNQYHKLYVHDDRPDGYNLCRDGFGHHNRGLERVQVDRLLSRIEASIGVEEWDRQAKVQGLNPCIYTFVQRWVMTLPSL